mmetsp:Transcript_44427/g.81318  ORF Transcript_44427/g.81318 Transcript_44427/m.81318 type:complete len:106 (-) Transcript_44427:1025-1342(-)
MGETLDLLSSPGLNMESVGNLCLSGSPPLLEEPALGALVSACLSLRLSTVDNPVMSLDCDVFDGDDGVLNCELIPGVLTAAARLIVEVLELVRLAAMASAISTTS